MRGAQFSHTARQVIDSIGLDRKIKIPFFYIIVLGLQAKTRKEDGQPHQQLST